MATQLREVLADHGLPADNSLAASIDQAARLVLGVYRRRRHYATSLHSLRLLYQTWCGLA